MVFRPNEYRNKDGIGMPADDIATNTTDPNALVALTKGIFGKLGGGTASTIASDVAQGSTTSGQTGGLVQGAVTTAAPTYVTAKTYPLSLKTNGDLRVSDTAATAILSTLNLSTDGLEAGLGIITETAPATDTASSGLNGRLQRVAQRITSLIAQIPATLGAKTAAASLSVTTATDDNTLALFGAVTETAPATDIASSGLNGRLQRVAQRLTSLIALVPASLGQKAMSASFAVALASDQTAIPVQPGSSAATGGIPSTTRLLSAAGTSGDATNVKASAGRVYAIQGYNAASAVRYLKLYNSASAPTAGSGTPVKTLALPALTAFALDWPVGLTFSTGIGFTLVTGSADNSSTSVTAADILALNIDYA